MKLIAIISVDLAGLLGDEGRLVPSGVEYGEGCSLPSRLEGLWERRELPQRGRRKRILTYFEGHTTPIFVPI